MEATFVCRALAVVCIVTSGVPLTASGTSFLEDFRERTQILPNDEVRAAWVTRFALNSREDVDRAVEYAVRARFHLLFVQVRGRGDAYYRSSLEPPASTLQVPLDQFDPLAYFIERAHANDISVHAWVNCYYVWSNPESDPPADHVVRRHPDWLMADHNGVRMDERRVDAWQKQGLEGYYVSPGNPAARAHTLRVIQEIVSRYPVDGVHLDYVRYPGQSFDFNPIVRTEFALRYGVDFADTKSSIAGLFGDDGVAFYDSLYAAWRTAQVDSLVRGVRRLIDGRPLSAAVISEYNTAVLEKGQDWIEWIRRGDVDFVVPMAYAYEPGELVESVQLIKRMVGPTRFLIGLPVFDGRDRYLGYSVSLLRQEGVFGYALFSYNALAEERFSLQLLERVFFGSSEEN